MFKTTLLQMLSVCMLLIATLFTAESANAQIWGVGSSNPVSDTIGRFAKPWGEPNAWTAVSVNDPSGTPGAAFWTRSMTGRSQGAYFGTLPAINSPSMADGVALFDSDYLDNNGTAGAFGTGTSPSPHKGRLVSPIIDLTGYTDSTIKARFYLYYRPFAVTEMSIGISTNAGATWTDYSVNQGVANGTAFTAAFVEKTLFGALNGVTNLTQCQLRFTFDGDYYFMMVDDLSLWTAPAFDLYFPGSQGGNTLGAKFSEAYTSGYRYFPFNQRDASQFIYGARVGNRGGQNMTAANNARLELQIARDVAGTWMPVYNDTMMLSPIASGAVDSIYMKDITNISWLDSMGSYRTRLLLRQDMADNPANDTVYQYFDATENRYSRCRNNTTDGQVGGGRIIFPGVAAGNVITEFEYGSMYYFPRGTGGADTILLDSVNYRYYASTSSAPNTRAPINVRVYTFVDNGDGSLDSDPNTTELTLVGLGVDTVQLTAGQRIPRTVSIFDVNTFEKLHMVAGKIYMVSLDQRNPSGLRNSSNQFIGAWYAADELNYALNAAYTDEHPSPVRSASANATTLIPATNAWNWVGFGADIQPSIRLVMKNTTGSNPVSVHQVQMTKLEGVVVYPNPTNDLLNVKVELKNTGDVQYLVTNISGQIIRMENSSAVQSEVKTFDVSNLAQGVYFVTVQSAEGTSTTRFVKK